MTVLLTVPKKLREGCPCNPRSMSTAMRCTAPHSLKFKKGSPGNLHDNGKLLKTPTMGLCRLNTYCTAHSGSNLNLAPFLIVTGLLCNKVVLYGKIEIGLRISWKSSVIHCTIWELSFKLMLEVPSRSCPGFGILEIAIILSKCSYAIKTMLCL